METCGDGHFCALWRCAYLGLAVMLIFGTCGDGYLWGLRRLVFLGGWVFFIYLTCPYLLGFVVPDISPCGHKYFTDFRFWVVFWIIMLEREMFLCFSVYFIELT